MKSYADYVNTNTGTIGHLLTSTSPTVLQPHGMMQTVPVFAPGVMDKYTSDKIYGFSIGVNILTPYSSRDDFDFMSMASIFDHDFETALPYYYNVLLEDYDIFVEYSVLRHSGLMRLTYPEGEKAGIILYMLQDQNYKILEDRIEIYNDEANGLPFLIYDFSEEIVVSEGSSPIPNMPNYIYRAEGRDEAKALNVKFSSSNVKIRYALSHISIDRAELNRKKEIDGFDFEDVKNRAREGWDDKLSTIKVKGGNEKDKKIFYTAMYRALSRMTNISENGKYYSGIDNKIYDDEGHEYYINDGMWDTYRCMHPLQLIIEEDVHKDIVESYIRMFDRSNRLAAFPFMYGDRPVMLGNHTTSLFADTLAKDVDFDLESAYRAVKKTLMEDSLLPWYIGPRTKLDDVYFEKGFFPARDPKKEEDVEEVHSFENRQSVAVTLEAAYDDWCAAQMAKELGYDEDYEYFSNRALNYKNLFDKSINFMAPKTEDGEWVTPFNPTLCGGQGGREYYAENNAWIYTLHVQHDVEGLAELFGGKKELAEYLDRLFIEQYEIPKYKFLSQYPDATGLMGQYCHGNEPSFHIPYMYNYVDQPWKTQRKIHEIIRLWYHDGPLGICGDEDGGAMSSWLVFSAMGFYPVCPGSNVYDIGSPIFDEIVITMKDGKELKIRAEGASNKKKYIQSAKINGIEHNKPWFTHQDIKDGGLIEFVMGERPNKSWGVEGI